jgi:hypothetical protein
MFNEKNVKFVKKNYLKVISKIQPPNHEFFLQFVRAMVCKAKGIKLNWVVFGVHYMNFIHKFKN